MFSIENVINLVQFDTVNIRNEISSPTCVCSRRRTKGIYA